MAFLDNSGDIILDAVLTDIGRKRMAQGDFRITKFAIGDDEIDYGLYNKNHPSGSAYADLEILQTPILEAFTAKNANINYGLVSRLKQDLLYLPEIFLNEKTFSPRIARKSSKGIIFLADDSKASAAGATTSKTLETAGAATANILKSGDATGRLLLIETGIDSSDLLGTAANQKSFLASSGLLDNQFVVRFDNRFISNVLGAVAGSSFANNQSQGATLNTKLTAGGSIRPSRSIANNSEVLIPGILNRVYSDTTASGTADTSTQYSTIVGPRASWSALNFAINANIPQSYYAKYGTEKNDLFSDGTLFDFIDTTVYIQGASTNATLQVPIRIIKVAQT